MEKKNEKIPYYEVAEGIKSSELRDKKEHLKKLRKVLQDTIENASYEEEKSLGEYMIAHFRGDGNKILVSKAVNDLYRIFRIIPGSMDFERKKITETMNARLF